MGFRSYIRQYRPFLWRFRNYIRQFLVAILMLFRPFRALLFERGGGAVSELGN